MIAILSGLLLLVSLLAGLLLSKARGARSTGASAGGGGGSKANGAAALPNGVGVSLEVLLLVQHT